MLSFVTSDINECDSNPCEDNCTDKTPGYVCSCTTNGTTLAADQKTCTGELIIMAVMHNTSNEISCLHSRCIKTFLQDYITANHLNLNYTLK